MDGRPRADSRIFRASEAGEGFLTLVLAALLRDDARSPRVVQAAGFVHVTTFLASACLLVTRSSGALLLEQPVQSSELGFGLSAAVLGFVYLGLRLTVVAPKRVEEDIPLGNVNSTNEKWSDWLRTTITEAPSYRRFLATVLAITLRVFAYEAVYRNISCSWSGVEALLPAAVFLIENNPLSTSRPLAAAGDESRWQTMLRVGAPLAVVTWAGIMAAGLGSYPRSTAICPAVPGTTLWTFCMQVSGMMLDAWILHSIRYLLVRMASKGPPVSRQTPLALSLLCMLSAGGVTLMGTLLAITYRQDRHFRSRMEYETFNALLWVTGIFSVLVLSGARMIMHGTSTDLTVILITIVSFVDIQSGFSSSAHAQMPLPWIWSFLVLMVGLILYYFMVISTRTSIGSAGVLREASQQAAARGSTSWLTARSSKLVLTVALVFGIALTTLLGNTSGVQSIPDHSHPLRSLIATADRVHLEWADQAARSKDLQEAVQNYKVRYNRHPPPGFDKWWEYATSRKSLVLDDFDTIEENLRPFWKIHPARLRQRVKTLLSDTSNACAEVSIRNGTAEVGQVIGTHRWMVDAIITMINPFVSELPDMDVAFNINDEPRVAIAHEKLKVLETRPVEIEKIGSPSSSWSPDRAAGWQLRDEEARLVADMRGFSFQQIWEEYGSISCPPDSPARTTRFWDSSTLCTSCYAPHSVGHFLSNWTLAGSPCHQPDLANMHGFYLSPSAFQATYQLIPIFSQSRTGGFADILYPTPWNYIDKVKYGPTEEYPDEEWDKKENRLFWHGSATEGFSRSGVWRGQARQRLVHLANNSTQKIPVLLPNPKGGWQYESVTTTEMLDHTYVKGHNLTLDVGFVDKYPRCDNGDCEMQEASMGLGQPTDFQYHWRHKFLLDADGAGFSGRFLPFLHSRSLPFKMAIFREWYDSRIIPWKHFVPIDIRLQGLWSSVVFFVTRFEAFHGVDRGKIIAENGREWAERVLRKEDMEIYFYRLLLEYARITDDNRASLGYEWKSS